MVVVLAHVVQVVVLAARADALHTWTHAMVRRSTAGSTNCPCRVVHISQSMACSVLSADADELRQWREHGELRAAARLPLCSNSTTPSYATRL